MTLRGGSSLSKPRYRVEDRSWDLATGIIGLADNLAQSNALLAGRIAQLTRASEAIVFRRGVWVTPKS